VNLSKCLFLCASALTAVSAQAAGITFNITYTNAVQTDSHFAQIQSAVNYVENEYSTLYSDPITLNFTIDEGAIGLGESLFSNNYFRGSYAQIRAALVADAKTSNDAIATAAANLPAADPYSGGCGNCWYATSAEAKALGLPVGNSDPTGDGTYTFDNTVSYTYNSLNRAVAGEYDFIGVTEHEFSELMGRTSQSIGAGGFGYDALDIYRYTSTGVEQPAQAAGVYFSYNSGVTNLEGYNAAAGGDRQDFNGSVATDPFNASTGTNQAHAINSVDSQEMDVIGYDLVTPEPSTFALGAVLLGIGSLLRKRVKA
jgi:hypothetical protein